MVEADLRLAAELAELPNPVLDELRALGPDPVEAELAALPRPTGRPSRTSTAGLPTTPRWHGSWPLTPTPTTEAGRAERPGRARPQLEISVQGWSHPISDAEAWARAGGRRHYNGTRQAHAQLRRAEVARLLATLGLRHGTQAVIARRLGVSEATISRDLTALFRSSRPRRCPLCGCGCAALADLGGTP